MLCRSEQTRVMAYNDLKTHLSKKGLLPTTVDVYCHDAFMRNRQKLMRNNSLSIRKEPASTSALAMADSREKLTMEL